MPTTDNPQMIHRLTTADKTVFLVGTAHVSHDSVAQVKAIIDAERPDTVAVELCDSRYQSIRHPDQWRQMDIVKVIREKKSFLLLSNLMLSAFQRRIAAKLDIKPGAEMIQAIESAEAIGAQVHLADRDVRVTLARTWRSMGLWSKLKLIFQLVLSLGQVDEIDQAQVEELKQQDMLEAVVSEVGKAMPEVRRILIDERDQYLAQRILDAPGRTVVAVVGAGHVAGIKRHWNTPVDLAPLCALPPKGRLGATLKYLLPAVILLVILAGFAMGGRETGTQMVYWWVAANGILAGLGAVAALAHPLTILTAVLAAPLTSLNPMIAAGWVSGLAEAIIRKPKVRDFESLPEDVLTVGGFWRNSVTKVLLVVVFTNIGSSIGTFVALPAMLRLFG